MSISTIRTLIAIVLIAHGLGHALGILAAMGITLSKNHSLYSWLLTKFTGQSVSTGIGSAISSGGNRAGALCAIRRTELAGSPVRDGKKHSTRHRRIVASHRKLTGSDCRARNPF